MGTYASLIIDREIDGVHFRRLTERFTDVLCRSLHGFHTVDVHVTGPDVRTSVLMSIGALQMCVPVRVLGVNPELVNAPEIAARLDLLPVHAGWSADAPGFPAPVAAVDGGPLWRWGEVAEWAGLASYGVPVPISRAVAVALDAELALPPRRD